MKKTMRFATGGCRSMRDDGWFDRTGGYHHYILGWQLE